jgi:hypothetical protein
MSLTLRRCGPTQHLSESLFGENGTLRQYRASTTRSRKEVDERMRIEVDVKVVLYDCYRVGLTRNSTEALANEVK